MKKVFSIFILSILICLTACSRWENRDCKQFYLCGKWELKSLFVNDKQRITDVTFFYNLNIYKVDEYGPNQGYNSGIRFFSDSTAYTYFVNGVEYPIKYGTSDGFWKDSGSYLYLYTNYEDSIKNSNYPGFLNDYNEGHSAEKWYYELLNQNNMMLTNNEYGKTIIAFLEKKEDYKCPCSFDH